MLLYGTFVTVLYGFLAEGFLHFHHHMENFHASDGINCDLAHDVTCLFYLPKQCLNCTMMVLACDAAGVPSSNSMMLLIFVFI